MAPEIVHIVLFRWQPGTDPAAIEAVLAGLRKLPDAIPGIVDLQCGPNFSGRSQGFETGLVVRFESRAALDSYLPHPAHRKLVDELINPIRADSLAVDFEVD